MLFRKYLYSGGRIKIRLGTSPPYAVRDISFWVRTSDIRYAAQKWCQRNARNFVNLGLKREKDYEFIKYVHGIRINATDTD